MTRFADSLLAHPFRYGAMPLAHRQRLLPERNVCSLVPGDAPEHAFWTGDGVQRVEIPGDPYDETLVFTHEALYEPKWLRAPEPPDLTGVLPEIRSLLREGRFTEAAEKVEEVQLASGVAGLLSTGPSGIMPPTAGRLHPAFRLGIRQTEAGETREYLRWLDLSTGQVTVQWENDLGTFSRETFVAYRGDVAVVRLTAPRGALDADLSVRLPGPAIGGRGGLVAPELCSHELETAEDRIVLRWAYCPDYGQKGYVSVMRLIREGGTAERTGEGVRIAGAESLLLLVKTVKFESDFTFACGDPVVREVFSLDPDYEALLAGNRAHLGARMDLSRIRLGDPADGALSAEELLRRTHSDVEFDGTLLEKLYDMGRFYQIIDTGAIPPMFGQHNINTNLQVCAGNNTGLFDEMDVYFRYYETKFEDFRTNARRLFGARGLLATVHCDYDSGLFYHFSKTYPHYCWTGCLGWIYNELWGYWLVTGDRDFLRDRVVPALREIALFFEDYACDRGPDGRVIFYPSFSPENPTPHFTTPHGTYAASINSVMDIMICGEVLDNLCEACRTLGIEEEQLPHWQAQRESLPRLLLDEEGGLKEWAWPSVGENYDHRHVSHHYDVWPGRRVTWEDEPALARAILVSNRKRAQQDDSAHGIIHRLLTAIRLKDLPETVQNLYQLMNQGFVTRSLHTTHYPYRVHFPDLQGAMPAILIEMCVYSAPGTVELLPAMPASLGRGGIEGVWLYTWAKLEHMEWDVRGVLASITSNRDQTLTLRCRRPIAAFRVNGSAVAVVGDHVKIVLSAGETAKIEIDFQSVIG